jgi:hypothetical protein
METANRVFEVTALSTTLLKQPHIIVAGGGAMRMISLPELRSVLDDTGQILVNYATLLAQVAGVPPLYH